jgi:phosphomevalonate kinase
MMDVTASTPGKMVLLGDYAVLEGAPALVMGVNRHARVRISAKAGGVAEVSAPDMNVAQVPLRIGADGLPEWLGTPEQAEKLRLVDQVLRGLHAEGLAPPPGRGFSLQLDTSEFFDQGADGRSKLGLGSSAALTVALASAMAVFVGRGPAVANRRVWLEHLLQLHRNFQGGHGSGVDVAAGLIGGVISYRLVDGGGEGDRSAADGRRFDSPRFEPVHWPAGVHARFVWTGRSASTSDFLGRLAAWRKGNGAEYASHMRALTGVAEAACEAAKQSRAAAFIESATAYGSALQAFGNACGLEIFSPEHVQLGRLSAELGLSYKPCGAGGGDFGVVFAQEPERLARAEQGIAAAGFRCVPLGVDEQGLHLEYTSY